MPEHPVDVPESWPVLASEDLHRGDWLVALRRDTLTTPDAAAEGFGRYVLEHPGAVVVLAVDEEDRVLVLHQYRHPAQRRMVELVAGLRDEPGEDPFETARRELREEASYEAGSWRHLLTTYSSPGITDERVEFYLARDLSPAAPAEGFAAEHEEAHLTTHWVPRRRLVDDILSGRVTNAALATAVLAYTVDIVGETSI